MSVDDEMDELKAKLAEKDARIRELEEALKNIACDCPTESGVLHRHRLIDVRIPASHRGRGFVY